MKSKRPAVAAAMGIGERVKQHWASNSAFLDYLRPRRAPPQVSDADFNEFIASDLVDGPSSRPLWESRQFALVEGFIGAAHLGGMHPAGTQGGRALVPATLCWDPRWLSTRTSSTRWTSRGPTLGSSTGERGGNGELRVESGVP